MFPVPQSAVQLRREHAWAEGVYTVKELSDLVAFCETLPKHKATIGAGSVNEKHRDSSVAWIPFPQENPETLPIYSRLSERAGVINDKYFKFNLLGFTDRLQYTVYNAKDGDQHYDWHKDDRGEGAPQRKLSFSLLLTHPFDYEGGDLWIWGSSKIALAKTHGLMHYFPGYTQHRVTPVTKGIRRSIVGWITGPDFV